LSRRVPVDEPGLPAHAGAEAVAPADAASTATSFAL
jgi:hypothetical protein